MEHIKQTEQFPTLPNDLDNIISKYFSYEAGYFIEVGANDGYAQSNTYRLEKERNWRGVLIEAIPELYKACRETRENSKVFNYALVSNDFGGETVKMHYANLMSFVDGALGDNEEQENFINRGVEIQQLSGTYEIDVPTCTLTEILDMVENIPEIDLFSLDVEGYELEVLKGLNFDKYCPKNILVETWQFNQIESFLNKKYKLIDKVTVHDYLFEKR